MTEKAKSYSQMRKEFYEKYTNKIVPLVKKYENSRRIRLVFAILSSFSLIVLGSLVTYFAYIYGDGITKGDVDCLELALTLYFLSYFVWFRIKKRFENTIKEKIMPTVCSCFDNIKWTHGSYSGSEVFSASCVIPQFTLGLEDYDDIFIGSYKDVNIEIIESKYRIDCGKHQRIVFKGVIVKLNMNKPFASHTVVKPNSLTHTSPSSGLCHTVLEDVEFNKKFDVYTNDEIDARYLITPSFMERLKKIKTTFKANNVSCAFFGDLLIIALSIDKDLFSICSLIRKIDDSKQYFQMYEEILSIVKLIDHFKLNQKIGL